MAGIQLVLINQVRQINAILVTGLSRWGRSTQDLLTTLDQLANWKNSVVAMSGMTLELDTPPGHMMATMLTRVAQFERDLLIERVKSGLAGARARSKKPGRQKGQRPGTNKLAPQVIKAIARHLGLSRNTVLEIMKRHRESAYTIERIS